MIGIPEVRLLAVFTEQPSVFSLSIAHCTSPDLMNCKKDLNVYWLSRSVEREMYKERAQFAAQSSSGGRYSVHEMLGCLAANMGFQDCRVWDPGPITY